MSVSIVDEYGRLVIFHVVIMQFFTFDRSRAKAMGGTTSNQDPECALAGATTA
tara:strand:- start:945 stop:1103 length:159 start_codon:yes stop_codon:yes gene_type:complete